MSRQLQALPEPATTDSRICLQVAMQYCAWPLPLLSPTLMPALTCHARVLHWWLWVLLRMAGCSRVLRQPPPTRRTMPVSATFPWRSKLGSCVGCCMRQDPVPDRTDDLLLLGSEQ